MSLPGIISSLPAVTSMNPMDILMASINSNPYFIGIMMVLLNIGGRFLSLEISKEQEKFLSTPIVRRFLLFAILFVGTRNIIIAGCLTIVLILLIGYLFNENSDLCIWHSCSYKPPAAFQQVSTNLSAEEYMIYKRLHDKIQNQTVKEAPSEEQRTSEEPSAYSYYLKSIQQLGITH
jgi:hypothetical protein